MAALPQASPANKGQTGTGSGAEGDSENEDPQASEKVLGKRRARMPLGATPEAQEENESLSEVDTGRGPEDIEIDPGDTEGTAPKFARLTSEPQEETSQQDFPQPGPSTTRGARGIKTFRRRTPRTRAAGKEGSPTDLDALPNEAPQFECRWVPLEEPNRSPCRNTCTRLSDLRRHQQPHFELDLEYAKEHLDEEAVARAQTAIDKCAGRGQPYACEVCGKVYSRLDAVARHRQQPQGRKCNTIYKQRRAAERKRAGESQEAAGMDTEKEME
ncbi:hypothetical protein BDV93DRAFT_605434 [Ceratobasidium sp. AG-I]|nr:hypothetical protein BDV93DRAFT_605434 [Ceratobasidium sp. AG-I]